MLVVQCRETDPAALASLAERLRAAVYEELGIECLIDVVAPHTLPRTSSGKLSRSSARKQFLQRHGVERAADLPWLNKGYAAHRAQGVHAAPTSPGHAVLERATNVGTSAA